MYITGHVAARRRGDGLDDAPRQSVERPALSRLASFVRRRIPVSNSNDLARARGNLERDKIRRGWDDDTTAVNHLYPNQSHSQRRSDLLPEDWKREGRR